MVITIESISINSDGQRSILHKCLLNRIFILTNPVVASVLDQFSHMLA